MPDEDAHLLLAEAAVQEPEDPGDHEEPRLGLTLLRVRLALRSLRHVQDVLDRERVEVVLAGERLDDAEVRETSDVDPAHRRPVRTVLREERHEVAHFLAPDLGGTEVDTGDARRARGARKPGEVLGAEAGPGPRRGVEPRREPQPQLGLGVLPVPRRQVGRFGWRIHGVIEMLRRFA